MHLPIEGNAKEISQLGGLVHATARTVLATSVKVDEHQFRRKQAHLLPEILKRLNEARILFPAPVLELEAQSSQKNPVVVE